MNPKHLLFYDTETTGFPDLKAPDDSTGQPHLVQLAALKVDAESREVISSINLLVNPDGWQIPEEVTAIHGITQEHAGLHGIWEGSVITLLLMLSKGAIRVAHNESFDAKVCQIAATRYLPPDAQNLWLQGQAYCTCNSAAPILKLPPSERMKAKNIGGYKKPNLAEAYRFFFDRPITKAHNAMADAQACMEVYWAIQDHLRDFGRIA